MKSHHPIRLCLGVALLLSAATPALARAGQRAAPPAPRAQRAQQPGPAVRSGPAVRPGPNAARPEPNIAAKPAQNQEHLERWMQNHQNLALPDQLRELQNMPGFRSLPPQVQQRELNEYVRLYNMNPQQRARTLDRNEALESMTPPQRQQWRDAVQQMNALPTPRRQQIARAVVDVRELPPNQREQTLDSPGFRAQFSDGERSLIRTLLTAEPYSPPAPTPAP